MNLYDEYVEYLKRLAPEAKTWVQEQIAGELYTRDNSIKSLREGIAEWEKEIVRIKKQLDLSETERAEQEEEIEVVCEYRATAWAAQAEIDRLNEVIDRAAKAWMSLEPPVAWEGDVADAMAAGVAEIERLRKVIADAERVLEWGTL